MESFYLLHPKLHLSTGETLLKNLTERSGTPADLSWYVTLFSLHLLPSLQVKLCW